VVTPDMTRCYQVMETDDRALLDPLYGFIGAAITLLAFAMWPR